MKKKKKSPNLRLFHPYPFMTFQKHSVRRESRASLCVRHSRVFVCFWSPISDTLVPVRLLWPWPETRKFPHAFGQSVYWTAHIVETLQQAFRIESVMFLADHVHETFPQDTLRASQSLSLPLSTNPTQRSRCLPIGHQYEKLTAVRYK